MSKFIIILIMVLIVIYLINLEESITKNENNSYKSEDDVVGVYKLINVVNKISDSVMSVFSGAFQKIDETNIKSPSLIQKIDEIKLSTPNIFDSLDKININTPGFIDSIDQLNIKTPSILDSIDRLNISSPSVIDSINKLDIKTKINLPDGVQVTNMVQQPSTDTTPPTDKISPPITSNLPMEPVGVESQGLPTNLNTLGQRFNEIMNQVFPKNLDNKMDNLQQQNYNDQIDQSNEILYSPRQVQEQAQAQYQTQNIPGFRLTTTEKENLRDKIQRRFKEVENKVQEDKKKDMDRRMEQRRIDEDTRSKYRFIKFDEKKNQDKKLEVINLDKQEPKPNEVNSIELMRRRFNEVDATTKKQPVIIAKIDTKKYRLEDKTSPEYLEVVRNKRKQTAKPEHLITPEFANCQQIDSKISERVSVEDYLNKFGYSPKTCPIINKSCYYNKSTTDYLKMFEKDPRLNRREGVIDERDEKRDIKRDGKNIQIRENFGSSEEKNTEVVSSFKPITNNKIYYIIDCQYEKDDCFYDALKSNNFVKADGSKNKIEDACLITACSYEDIEDELSKLAKDGLSKNKNGDNLRVHLVDSTDQIASKIMLWRHLKTKYGDINASKIVPYSWDLSDPVDYDNFKKIYNPNKLYITKNNRQRQEGIKIHNDLESILNRKSEYVVVQELLQNPYTISKRKINLRVYVLFIKDNNGNIQVLVYQNGFMYYTPEFFEKNSNDFKKNITTGYIDRQVYVENPLTHEDFKKYLDSNRALTDFEKYLRDNGVILSDYLFNQIYLQVSDLFNAFTKILGKNTPYVAFQLYGVDVAVDDKLRPMIMEVNKGPDLGAKDERDKQLKFGLSNDMLKSIGLIPNIDNKFKLVLSSNLNN